MENHRIKVRIPESTTHYKVNLTDEEKIKFLKRSKTVELWENEVEIKKDSSTELKLKDFDEKDILKIVFQPVTKETMEKNEEVALAIKNPKLLDLNYYFGKINNSLIVFPKNDLAYNPIRTKISSNTELVETFELKEISVEELAKKRNSNIPGFVLKEDKKYFYTDVNPKIRFVSECFLGYHMCSFGNKDCSRLSAALDEEGGCARIRDANPWIEEYDFISKGVQTFNTKANCFVILSCGHYAPYKPRKSVTQQKKELLMESLANFYYDDFPTYEDIHKRNSEAKRYVP